MAEETALQGSERIHLIGIGGAGLSAIARVLLERGHAVAGSDLRDSPVLHDLASRGATVYVGHDPAQIERATVVVASSAVPAGDPEVQAARQLGRPLWHRGEMLRRLTAGRQCLAVAGTHGKTTTTAMLTLVLRAAGLDPSFIIGGEVPELGSSGHDGRGPHFVLEADEYDHTFLALRPAIAVVTNVDWDHVDCYPTQEDVARAFAQFIAGVPADGAVLLGQDDRGAWSLPRPAAPVWGYGLASGAHWQATDVKLLKDSTTCTVLRAGAPVARLHLSVPGEHNVRNALGALAAAAAAGVEVEKAAATLAGFGGVQRRFQVLGTAGGVTVVDDYAHHPREVQATLAAARQRFPGRRLIAVFQPHTFSRTRALFHELAQALDQADIVLVSAIYAAREADCGDISGADIAAGLARPAAYVPTLDAALAWLQQHRQAGDVVLTLGAGDVTTLGPRLLGLMVAKRQE